MDDAFSCLYIHLKKYILQLFDLVVSFISVSDTLCYLIIYRTIKNYRTLNFPKCGLNVLYDK